MDNEFPDPDEEFDLAHEDDFELLNELEGFSGKGNITYLFYRLQSFKFFTYFQTTFTQFCC